MDDEKKPYRLFIAIDLPTDVKERLGKVIELVRPDLDAKWVQPKNFHMTLKFLGSTSRTVFEPLADALESVDPFDIRISEFGAFPSPRRARVLWAGGEDVGGRASSLASRIDKVTAGFGFEKETRRFSPHVTLARLRHPGPVETVIAEMGATAFVATVPVDAIVLFRSRLKPTGPVYDVAATFPFKGGAVTS